MGCGAWLVLFNMLSISGGGTRGPHPLFGGVNDDPVLHRRRLVRQTLIGDMGAREASPSLKRKQWLVLSCAFKR